MGISKGYVCELCSRSSAHNSPGPKANILVDHHGRACLADFTLLIAEQRIDTSSAGAGGTVRWMSPELLDPKAFGLADGRPTRGSDCYAFGMVIYEVLSGRVPFDSCGGTAVIFKVVCGERPEKPEGVRGEWFTAKIWATLELCWESRPADRPSSRDILQVLEGSQSPLRLSPPYIYTNEGSDAYVASSSLRMFSLFRLRFQAHFNPSGSFDTLPCTTQTLELPSNYPFRIVVLPNTVR